MSSNKKVALVPKPDEDVDIEYTVFSLPHPRLQDVKCRYMEWGGHVYEMQSVGYPSSWFCEDYVIFKGKVLVCTIVDPVFLLLPQLVLHRNQTNKSEGYFCSFEQILTSEWCGEGFRVLGSVPGVKEAIRVVCEVIEENGDGDIHYRLNNDLLLHWLRAKVNKITVHVSSSFNKELLYRKRTNKLANVGAKESALGEDEVLLTALDLVSEYITNEWNDVLRASYDLKKEKLGSTSTGTKPHDIVWKHQHRSTGYDEDEDEPKTPPKPKRKERKPPPGNTLLTKFFSPSKAKTT